MAAPITPTLNTGLFNLIIYTDNPRRREFSHEIVNILIKKYPCRVIFIECDEAVTSASPEISKIGDNKCCDQIQIRASSKNIDQVLYILLSSLIPDLPVYLIWGQVPSKDDPLLKELLKLTTRIIYDSECSGNLNEYCKRILADFCEDTIDHMDIDWALTRGWREIVAKIFDTPDKMEILKRTTSIQISYNDIKSSFIKHFSTRAYYLQGWIAAQLGWKFESQNNATLTYSHDKVQTAIELIADHHPHTPPGTITKVIFKTNQNEEIKLIKMMEHSVVFVHVTRGDKCELPVSFRLPNFQRGLSFVKEIFYYKTTDHYKNMLQILQNIDWHAK